MSTETNPISLARQAQLDKVFEDLDELLYDGELLRFEAVEELMTPEMTIDLRYLKTEFITTQVNEAIFQKQVAARYGTSNFKGVKLSEPLALVTEAEFLDHYIPAKFINQRRWVRYWLMRGKSLRRWQLHEWIMKTAKPKIISSRAPLDKVV